MKTSFLLLCIIFISFSSTFSQWTEVGTVTGAGPYPCISVVDESTVFIFGGLPGEPTVFRSTDGGENFTTLGTTGLGSLELMCGWAVDTSLIFAGNGGSINGLGGNASFYKTTNGGALWTEIDTTGGTFGFFNGVVFSKTEPMFGVAESDPADGAGNPYLLWITTDGGANWNKLNPLPPGIPDAMSVINSVMVIDDQFYGFGIGYFTGSGTSKIYMTADGGTNWSIGELGIAGNFVLGFAFSEDKMRGIAGTPDALPTIARTFDGGETWSPINTNTGITSTKWYGASCKWIPYTDVCYIAGELGSGGVIAKSTDGGLNWTSMTTDGVTDIFHMEFYTAATTDDIIAYGYAVTGNERVLKLIDIVVSVELTSTAAPADFVLKQNYPNPLNPATTITFSVPVKANVVLKVYNSLGEEVAQIVNEEKPTGTYEITWYAENLPSGIYFYRLQAGEFIETKKMVLMK